MPDPHATRGGIDVPVPCDDLDPTHATPYRVAPFVDDGDVQLYHGDVLAVLRSLPAGIVQTCVTSPPYWGLRDYGTGQWDGGGDDCDHLMPANGVRDKGRNRAASGGTFHDSPVAGQIQQRYGQECGRCGARRVDQQLGLEATPDLYVERMVAVFREVWRVLRDDGTVWVNLGDSYHGGGYANHAVNGEEWLEAHDGDRRRTRQQDRINANPGLKPKDLVGIPWRVAFALQADGWYLRSDIIWNKPNPMPESVTDRPTKAHEYLFLLTKRPRYFYDADAIREDAKDWSRGGPGTGIAETRHYGAGNGGNGGLAKLAQGYKDGASAAGRNRRSVWTIATEPFPEAHFATYPQELVRPCILAGTSECGECSVCGAPWVREVEVVRGDRSEAVNPSRGQTMKGGRRRGAASHEPGWRKMAPDVRGAAGWRASCGCRLLGLDGVRNGPPPARPQTVLDPFIGSGTTALVARKHGRRCIGIDLSAEYLEIAARRLQQLSLFAEPA